ncbi:MAG TPA: DNA primase [Chloroflexi bacterium]|nr:DNA primase [Chloroflexota bacterium]
MSVIDQVKERLDIVEVISTYIPLQKAGRNYKALCPFHSEKTPSFVVFPDSQRWHCFGACSEGGDIFSFVTKWEGWDFRTALEELARRAGVELQPPTQAQQQAEEEADRLRELLATAAQYYQHLLRHAPEAESARAYVARRSLNDETLSLFSIGYSMPGWDHTRAYLTERGFTVQEILKAGLLVEREDTGSTYDRFRDRLMIPIRDVQGRVIGFGARTLDPQGTPKYINSPQTDLFDKSRTLFGLDLARQAIRREDRAIIVEGYMDVMQAHQSGFNNVVAQMGTALTEPQLRQLQRYTQRLVLALDPDAAGIQATLRGFEVARETLETWEPVFDPRGLVGHESRLGAEIRILRLPPGQDPDDLIRQDAQRWITLVNETLPVVDFYLQVLTQDLDLNDTKVKAQVVDALLPVLRAVANPVERNDFAQKIARVLRVDARAVQSRLLSAEHRTPPPARAATRGQKTPDASSLDTIKADLEGHCLAIILQRPTILAQVDASLVECQQSPVQLQDFEEPVSRAIFEAWEATSDTGQADAIEALRRTLPTDLHSQVDGLLATHVITPTMADEQIVRDLVLTILRIRERRLKHLGQELAFLRMAAQENGDMRTKQYDQAQLTHAEQLRRTQWALSQRWNWTGRG